MSSAIRREAAVCAIVPFVGSWKMRFVIAWRHMRRRLRSLRPVRVESSEYVMVLSTGKAEAILKW